MLLHRTSLLAALIVALGNTAAPALADSLGRETRPLTNNAPMPSATVYRSPIAATTHLVLSLSDRRVYVYRDRRLQASYPVAVGKPGWETPTGTFRVFQKVTHPDWESPFTGEIIPAGTPENPLGPRWIAFWTDGNNAIGFHGTPFVNSIGHAASFGCARMRNEDIIALFEQVDIGTTVTVIP